MSNPVIQDRLFDKKFASFYCVYLFFFAVLVRFSNGAMTIQNWCADKNASLTLEAQQKCWSMLDVSSWTLTIVFRMSRLRFSPQIPIRKFVKALEVTKNRENVCWLSFKASVKHQFPFVSHPQCHDGHGFSRSQCQPVFHIFFFSRFCFFFWIMLELSDNYLNLPLKNHLL